MSVLAAIAILSAIIGATAAPGVIYAERRYRQEQHDHERNEEP